MLYMDDIIPMRLYKKKVLLPLNLKNKIKGSSIMLLTPNYRSSVNIMNNPLFIPKYYNSYYIEKDVTGYITNENTIEFDNIYMDVLDESKIVYTGSRYDINHIKNVIDSNFIDSMLTKMRIHKNVRLSVCIYPDNVPKCEPYKVNVCEFSNMDKGDIYNKYLRCSAIQSLCLILNSHMNPRFIEGYSALESGYIRKIMSKNDDNINAVVEIFKFIAETQSYNTVINIIKDNNINLFNYYVAKYKFGGLKDGIDNLISDIDEEIFDEETSEFSINHIVNKIKRGGRKSKYYHNKLNRIIDVADPHNFDGTIGKQSPDSVEHVDDNKPDSTDSTEEDRATLSENAVMDFDINSDDVQYEDSYIRLDDTIFILDEDSIDSKMKKNNTAIKKNIYKDRLRKNKDVFLIYDNIKNDVPYIKNTFIDYKKYKGKNLIIDFHYYNESFFKNNIYKLDKAVDVYVEFLDRLINDKRIKSAGYEKKFVIVPVNDWHINPETRMWMYNKEINPISCLYRLILKNLDLLKNKFKDVDFLFVGENFYFKLNFNTFNPQTDKAKFLKFIKLINNNVSESDNTDDFDTSMDNDSAKALTINTIDKIEKAKGIQISNMSKLSNIDIQFTNHKDIEKTILNANNHLPKHANIPDEPVEKDIDSKKDQLVDAIALKASYSDNEKELIDKLDNTEYVNKLLDDISATEGYDKPITQTRATRIAENNSKFQNTKYNNKKISDIINNSDKDKPIPITKLPKIDTVNEDMKELKFINFDKDYDPNEDIIAMLESFAHKSYPISILDLNISDASTSEDFIDNYKVKMEDSLGKRFTLDFDIPKFKENKYMLLRGNKKNIYYQLFLMPMSKSSDNKAQMVSNYSKIFIERFGSSVGKSFMIMDRIIKVLQKNTFSFIKTTSGNNGSICNKYDLPIDYIDLSNLYNIIEITMQNKDVYKIYFNQDILRKDIEIKDNNDTYIGIKYTNINKNPELIKLYPYQSFSEYLLELLLSAEPSFEEHYKNTSNSTRYMYSRCSILNEDIPLIIVCCYSEGLSKVLSKAGIKYNISEKKPNFLKDKMYNWDSLRFKDGYLNYELTYSSSLLLNGFKAIPIDEYSIFDMDKKSTYLSILDLFGGRIKGDGLDNFYDLMIDPITEEVCKHYNLPTDYIELLLYGNMLLSDNKFIRHTNVTSKRLRRKELVAGYTYLCLAHEYGNYCNRIKHGNQAPMSIKKSAIIDKIMEDPTMGELSLLNPLLEIEAYNSVSTKGLTGMNSERGYDMDKRGYDETMKNTIALSTGFASTVGVAREVTMNANIDTQRGYINDNTNAEINASQTFSVTEGITPYGTMRDDPFRSAMNYVQRSKHGVRTVGSSPSLISTGMDEVLPYLISDVFAFKSKSNGEVVELVPDKYMIVKYDDNTCDYINLSEFVEKNSNGGFFITVHNTTDLKVGSKFKANEILAYDKSSFSKEVGTDDNCAYNVGNFTKIAIMTTDEGYEDSTIISHHLSEQMASEQVLKEDKMITPQSNIFNMVNIGDSVQEGVA